MQTFINLFGLEKFVHWSVSNMANIIVLVKQVPDTNARIALSGDRVDLSAVKKVMSPYDEFAVETALQHRDSSGGVVTALSLIHI